MARMIAQLYDDDTVGYKGYDDERYQRNVVTEQKRGETHSAFLQRVTDEYRVQIPQNSYGSREDADIRILSQDQETLFDALRHGYGANKILDDTFIYECVNKDEDCFVIFKATLLKIYHKAGGDIDPRVIKYALKRAKQVIKGYNKIIGNFTDEYALRIGGVGVDHYEDLENLDERMLSSSKKYQILLSYTSNHEGEQIIPQRMDYRAYMESIA